MSRTNKQPSMPLPGAQPDYEKAEMDLLRDGVKMTIQERFEAMMNLIKMSKMFSQAKITHSTVVLKQKR